MMAPQREQGQQTFELPKRQPPRRQPALIYRERMQERRQQVARASAVQRARAAKVRRGWALCMALAAGLMVLCGMRIYQSALATRNAAAITALKDDIHELTMDAETYECRIASAASEENIEAGAERLGMTYPTDGQVRTIGD